MTTTTNDQRHDKYGFPLRECSRCGGCGRYSWNQRDGDKCFGCGGTGWQHTPKAGKAFAAFRDACKKAMNPVIADCRIGDEVRGYGAPKGSPFSKIAWIVDTGERAGYTTVDGVQITNATFVYVGLEDGEVWNLSTMNIIKRNATVEVAPFLAGVPGAKIR